jgi:hypothetical protein
MDEWKLTRPRACAVLILLSLGCGVFAPNEATGVLTGKVYRGPIAPVCQPTVPCDAPFSATFDVRRGSWRVATFTSGADGSFSVALPAGELLVIPRATAPIMDPTSQVKSVVLQPGMTTVVDLFFDTGIR